jgi:hypothetical protein
MAALDNCEDGDDDGNNGGNDDDGGDDDGGDDSKMTMPKTKTIKRATVPKSFKLSKASSEQREKLKQQRIDAAR